MILLIASIVLLLVGMPVAVALGGGSLAEIWFGTATVHSALIPQRLVQGLASFPLLAVPFFILAAEVMNASNVTNKMLRPAKAIFGPLPGGMAQVNIGASMIFSGVTGSAVADAASIGRIEIRAMQQAGYTPQFSAAVTAASATIGPIIPPSIPFVIYGSVADVSIGKLLLAGTLPGVLMSVMMMAAVAILATRRNFPRMAPSSWSEIGAAVADSLLPLMTPAILIVGIVSGYFTPTEASAVASIYAIILGLVVYRTINLRQLYAIFGRVVLQSAAVLFILAFASLLGLVFTRLGLPTYLETLIDALGLGPIGFLLLVNLLLLVVGCFLESLAALTILAPILAPIALAMGVDPIHFGVVFVFNLMIGLILPPSGILLMVVKDIARVSTTTLMRELMPFIVALLVTLAILTFVPSISTILPEILMP